MDGQTTILKRLSALNVQLLRSVAKQERYIARGREVPHSCESKQLMIDFRKRWYKRRLDTDHYTMISYKEFEK